MKDNNKAFGYYRKDGKKETFYYKDIVKCTHWNNMYGNPTYRVILDDGTDRVLVDDYAFSSSYVPVTVQHVSRKKDL